jgi:phage tail-like protein
MTSPNFFEQRPSDAAPSRLLTYLPTLYADDPFLGQFLNIFDSIWLPIERQIGQLFVYFDPRLTPSEFLPWLGAWVDLALDENWPEARRRELIHDAANLYRRRGTAGAMRDYLRTYTGVEPLIVEDGPEGNAFHFTVIFRVGDPTAFDLDRIKRIIGEEKPAHTTFSLKVEKA